MSAVTCPKCGYTRQPTDDAPEWRCPSCGVAYNKAEAAKRAQAARDAAELTPAKKEGEEARNGAKEMRICTACGATVSPIEIKRYNLFVAILLCCLGLIPGLVYLLRRSSSRRYECPLCKSSMAPIGPKGYSIPGVEAPFCELPRSPLIRVLHVKQPARPTSVFAAVARYSPIYIGPKGGRYQISASGKKVYLKR